MGDSTSKYEFAHNMWARAAAPRSDMRLSLTSSTARTPLLLRDSASSVISRSPSLQFLRCRLVSRQERVARARERAEDAGWAAQLHDTSKRFKVGVLRSSLPRAWKPGSLTPLSATDRLHTVVFTCKNLRAVSDKLNGSFNMHAGLRNALSGS